MQFNNQFNNVGEAPVEQVPIHAILTSALALLLFCGSMAAAVWVPVAWMKNIAPVQKAQKAHMQNQAKALYWKQSEEKLRRHLAPSLFAEHLPEDFVADYDELYRTYQQEMLEQFEEFDGKNQELWYEAYQATEDVLGYREMHLKYPEENNFLGRLKKTPYQTRFFYVLWGLTLTSLLAGYSLFRLRRSEKQTMLFLASFMALLSSGMLMVLALIYCWLGTATQVDPGRFHWGHPDFLGRLDDLWGMFVLLGLAGYVCAIILTFTVFFVPKDKTIFHRSRALFALVLVLLPSILGGSGGTLISKAPIDLRHWYTYSMLQKEEMPRLEALYQQFSEDYQLLIKQHTIRLPFVPQPGESFRSDRIPREQPLNTYWSLAVMLSQPKGYPSLVSWGNLDHWNPPQMYMTWSSTMAGLFVWATIVLFGVPGLIFAILHIARLKRAAPRKGLFLAGTAIFGYPVLFTIACIPLFFLEHSLKKKMEMTNSDHDILLFFAAFGTIVIFVGIYFLRRYLRQ